MPLIDVHAHLMLNNIQENRKNLLRTAAHYGLNRYYISTIDGNHAYPNEEFIDMDNRATADFMRDEPSLIRGYVYVNPRNSNAMQVLQKGIEEQKMSGMKLWVATHCNDPLVFPLVEKMIEYDKPVLIHTFVKAVGQMEHETTSYHVAQLAERYPEAKLIMAHLGGEAFHGIRSIAKYKNVWVDHSGTLVGSEDLNHTVRLLGADRVMFATDMPIAFASSYGQLLEAKITEEEREKIAWKTAVELFGEGL
ncbi:MAG: amidohydrolase [Ruminococcaceae bacterium]|nr:amidohydrolase [Oscillospiraceae bacterium]